MSRVNSAIIEFAELGKIKLEFYEDVENSVKNFLLLAKNGFYDGLIMHRIIPDFVAQGGCPDSTGFGNPGYSILGEFNSNNFNNEHKHQKGVIAWARGVEYNSAGSQFYLCLADAPHLDGDYAVFGYTVEGFDVLDRLNELGTSHGTPKETVIITKITVDLKDDYNLDVEKV